MWLFLAVAYFVQQTAGSEQSIVNRHLNPQSFMTIDEIIQYWGYHSEEHEILTEDGYFLKINRILYSPASKEPRPVVLLVHGLVAEGRCWIVNLPSNSLGFALADAGYDVWILNNRGTTWSRRHQKFSIEQEEFWNFSFHEMGIYDIPATINYILQKTKQEGLYFIGHSQGAAVGLVAFSLMPELAQKVKICMLFGPAYSGVDARGLFSELLLLPDGVKKLLWGTKEFRLLSPRGKSISAKLCSYTTIDRLCLFFLSLCYGFNEKNKNVSRADVYLGIFPDYTSMKTIKHWSQIGRAKEFKYFDYGSKNKAIYNMTTPPFYRIEDIIIPTAVWSGGKDIIINQKDTELLVNRLTHLAFYKNIPDWEHADYVFGLDAPLQLYPDVLALMQKYK